MRTISILLPAVLMILSPEPAHAWGYEAHRFIMDRAIALLPAPMRLLFERRRATLVERAVDADLWRRLFAEEPPYHQVDIDAYGEYPFRELPRDYTAAVAKFGAERVKRDGTLPWRAEELHGQLRREFEDYGRRPGVGSQEQLVFFAAALVHYISDAHVPFHAVANYDGQLTGQHGIHARFEVYAVERYRDRLAIAPKLIAPITKPRDFAFDTLLESARLAPDLLKADREAIGDRDVYDDAYYEAFVAKGVRSIMERRLNEAIAASAAIIAGAWEAAGMPAVAAELPAPTPQRRRR